MDDPLGIANWQRLSDRVTTSGQPSEAQLAQIAALGVINVINLALHSHERALPDEAASVAALGLTYIHIPVDFAAPTDEDFARFVAAMTASAGTRVHVHCIVNARVSAFFYRYRREVEGMDEAAARAAMEAIWRPGGVWAAFIGDSAAVGRAHLFAPYEAGPDRT